MPILPKDPAFDSTIGLGLDPYRYIMRRRRRLQADAFLGRLMLEPAIFGGGAAFARMFYDPGLMMRAGAMPRSVRRTLVGEGGVQTLDGAAHASRKAMFMEILTGASAQRLLERIEDELEARFTRWTQAGEIRLYDEMKRALAVAVCDWAGAPLPRTEELARVDDLAAMYEGAAAVGPRHWRARRARVRTEKWVSRLVEAIRGGRAAGMEGRPAARIALHTDENGRELPVHAAAVEIINLLRPVVAIAVYATFVAHALHLNRAAAARISDGDDALTHSFVLEVRRHYPFFPAIGARARRAFDFEGVTVPAGRLFLLDLFGTCHDERLFEKAHAFSPERFVSREPDPFALIPQGGGDHLAGHRCAGEMLTIDVMQFVARLLARRARMEVPPQDLEPDWRRPPAVPRTGLRISVHAR